MRSVYLMKNFALFVLILFDCCLNALIDHSVSQKYDLSLCGLQLVTRIAQLFIVLSLFWSTFVFRYGLLGILAKRFRSLLFATILTNTLMVALRSHRIAQILQYEDSNALYAQTGVNTLLMQFWSSRGYTVLFVFHNLASVLYSVSLLSCSFNLANPIFYRPQHWIDTAKT